MKHFYMINSSIYWPTVNKNGFCLVKLLSFDVTRVSDLRSVVDLPQICRTKPALLFSKNPREFR